MARYSKASKILLTIFLFTGAYISVVKLYQSNKTSSYLDFYAQEEAEARKIFSKQPPNVIPGLNLNQDRIKMLVIEGGGARGLFAIHILDYLEKKTGRPISQLYDVMGGTSIGSLLTSLLSVPKGSVAKYSARDVLDVFDDVAEKTLQPKLINKVLSGYGFFSPILENQKFILRLKEAYGDILFSQTLNHLILYSFNLNASKVMVMNNRGESLKKCNPVLYQLIGGTTAGYGIFPSNKVLLNDTGEGQFLVDAALIVNNPLLSMIIQVKKLYPNKKILVTYISLHTTDIAYRNKVRFYTGEIGSLKEYRLMIEHGRTQLINDYMDSLSSDFNFDYLTEIGVKEDAQWQRMNSFDFSKENLKIIDDFAKDIVKRNQKELDAVAEELLSD